MLKVLHRHWLRLRGKPLLTVVVEVSGQRDPVRVGDVLVDESGQEFTLGGVGHIRYATMIDADKHQHEHTITLVPAKDGTEPLTTLQKKPSYQGESPAGNTTGVPEGSAAPLRSGSQ